jgi:phosphoglucosamine mutase
LNDLGADVISIGCSPNGRNINDGCGSTYPELCQKTVAAVEAAVGISLDGDGDRVVMVDERGEIVDGDQLLYVLATARKADGELRGPVIGTVMSNLGLQHALERQDIPFRRVAVGDRYVLEALRETGGMIGGETSGHLICLDKTTTGDGLVIALQVLAVMRRTGKKLSELAGGMSRYPQTMLNVKTAEKLDPAEVPAIRDAVSEAEAELAESGRVVLRASGTEPVIRVMVEGENAAQVLTLAERLASVVAEAAT